MRKKCLQTQARGAEFFIRVASREGATVQGKIEHVQSGHIQYFRSLLEMALLVEEKMNALGVPQSTMEMRSWHEA